MVIGSKNTVDTLIYPLVKQYLYIIKYGLLNIVGNIIRLLRIILPTACQNKPGLWMCDLCYPLIINEK